MPSPMSLAAMGFSIRPWAALPAHRPERLLAVAYREMSDVARNVEV